MEPIDEADYDIKVEIPGFPGYFVNKRGEVFSFGIRWNKGRFKLKQYWNPTTKYFDVSPYVNGKKITKRVHILVALTFLGPCPLGKQVRHLDGIHENNYLYNLKYGTPKEDAEDRAKHGVILLGENNKSSKLTNGEVLEIRRRCAAGEIHAIIARDFGIGRREVDRIHDRTRWGHL